MTYHVPFLKKSYPEGYKLTGAEIGVWEGEGAVRLCRALDFSMLYLVDAYVLYDGYNDFNGFGDLSDWGKCEDIMKVALGIDETSFGMCNGQPVKLLKMMSADAAKTISDASLDFVYIDANHDYPYVLQDLKAWYSKVKPSGWVMGHDWPWPTVQRAVNEFMAERNLQFDPESGHLHGTHDWWFKPKEKSL